MTCCEVNIGLTNECKCTSIDMENRDGLKDVEACLRETVQSPVVGGCMSVLTRGREMYGVAGAVSGLRDGLPRSAAPRDGQSARRSPPTGLRVMPPYAHPDSRSIGVSAGGRLPVSHPSWGPRRLAP